MKSLVLVLVLALTSVTIMGCEWLQSSSEVERSRQVVAQLEDFQDQAQQIVEEETVALEQAIAEGRTQDVPEIRATLERTAEILDDIDESLDIAKSELDSAQTNGDIVLSAILGILGGVATGGGYWFGRARHLAGVAGQIVRNIEASKTDLGPVPEGVDVDLSGTIVLDKEQLKRLNIETGVQREVSKARG